VAKKRLGNIATVLGGLGAAYALTKGMSSKDGSNDPEAADRIAKTTADFASRPVSQPSFTERMQRHREDDRRREGKPVISPEEHAAIMNEVKGVRDSSGIPIKAGDGVLQETDPSVRPVRAQTPARFGFDTPLEVKHMLRSDLGTLNPAQFKKGGKVSSAKRSKVSSTKVSKVSSASKRADGIAQRGKTRGRIV